MDLKGVDFPGLNPFISALVKEEKRDVSALKPVERGGASFFRSLLEGEERSDLAERVKALNPEEQAKLAAEVLSDRLSGRTDLDVEWRFIKEVGQFVVEIKDRETGEVIRQIPPEALLGVDVEEVSGVLLNKTL